MKFLSRLLLVLAALFAGVYAATPAWLPYLFAMQLPPGWQLQQLDAGYPGLSAINIKTLRVTGDLQAAGLALAATDIRFSYRNLTTETATVSLDVFMQAAGDAADPVTLADLSLPVTKLTGRLPALSVHQLQVQVHPARSVDAGSKLVAQPLVLVFNKIKLVPGTDNSFHLDAGVSIQDGNGINGQVDVDASAGSLKAAVRFPVDARSPPWLAVSVVQQEQALHATTQVYAALDAEAADRQWLDALLAHSSDGMLTNMRGKLVLLADFSGKEVQDIEQLLLVAGQLQAGFSEETLMLDAGLLASRAGDDITVTLSKPAEIRYRDGVGRINKLLAGIVPGLQRQTGQLATAVAEIDAASRLVIQAGTGLSMAFSGMVKAGMASTTDIVSLQASDLQVEVGDLFTPGAVTATGLVALNWHAGTPFAYTTDELNLQADKLSLSTSGELRVTRQSLAFRPTGDFDLQLEGLRAKQQTGAGRLELDAEHAAMQGRLDIVLPLSVTGVPANLDFDGAITATRPLLRLSGEAHANPVRIEADTLTAAATLTSHDGRLVSSGSSTLTGAQVTPPDTSATVVDATWNELDLLALTGKLSTRTQGFSTAVNGETWTGFDFDIIYSLLENAGIKGSGALQFEAGPNVPVNFYGNTQTGRWDITLPATSVRLVELGSMLRAAHVEPPATVKLTDGYLDIQGSVKVAGEITAKMTISGHEMGASMQESSARKAGFSFETRYNKAVAANGPVFIEALLLAGGVDVSSIRADLDFAGTDKFGLKNLQAKVFDGQLTLGSLQFSENRIEDTVLELAHINLERLLAFADIDGLQGTGTLDISLPTGSDQAGIYVKNGTFSANGPGRLAYTKEGMAGSNIGLQALENFYYQDLSGTINYQSSGAYRIDLHLEGNNPDLYEGHPIVFNLNINGFLPEMFEALFITGNFEESILNQIRTK